MQESFKWEEITNAGNLASQLCQVGRTKWEIQVIKTSIMTLACYCFFFFLFCSEDVTSKKKYYDVGLQVGPFQCPASEAHNVAQETSLYRRSSWTWKGLIHCHQSYYSWVATNLFLILY